MGDDRLEGFGVALTDAGDGHAEDAGAHAEAFGGFDLLADGGVLIQENLNLNLLDCPTCENKDYVCPCAHHKLHPAPSHSYQV